jgi:hypothetical protein
MSWDKTGQYCRISGTTHYLHQYALFDSDTNIPYFCNRNYTGDYEHIDKYFLFLCYSYFFIEHQFEILFFFV